MQPHDMKGIPICRGDVVVCSIEERRLCFGVVSVVNYDTGVVTVQTISIVRSPLIVPKVFPFPCNQLCLIDYNTIQSNHPEHDIIGKFHRMYK